MRLWRAAPQNEEQADEGRHLLRWLKRPRANLEIGVPRRAHYGCSWFGFLDSQGRVPLRRLLPSLLASPCFLMMLCCLVAYTDLAACRHVPAFWGAMEDRQICFAWVVWTGALAPLVKGSSRTDC